MSTAVRIGAYLATLVGVFAITFGVGAAVGPLDPAGDEDGAHGHPDSTATDTPEATDGGHADHAKPAEAGVGGLGISQDGYRLELVEDRLAAGTQQLGLRIVDAEGEPVTSYDVVHEKRLHLIVVRRDLARFQHLHPELDPATGTWSTEVRLAPGAWRVFADTRPTGAEALVLGADLLVPGGFEPTAPGGDALADQVDGYEVTLGGELVAGRETSVTAAVSRDGEPVRDLEPYLGAHGHLVVLRAGDLAYLHAHPEEDGSAGPEITFHTTFPTPGRYRAFLDFSHEGRVRTAEFTVTVGGDADGTGTGGRGTDHDADHDH